MLYTFPCDKNKKKTLPPSFKPCLRPPGLVEKFLELPRLKNTETLFKTSFNIKIIMNKLFAIFSWTCLLSKKKKSNSKTKEFQKNILKV